MSFSKASQKHSPDQYGAVLIERENKKTPKTKQYNNILKREKKTVPLKLSPLHVNETLVVEPSIFDQKQTN